MSSKSSQVPLVSLQTRIAESEAKIKVEIEELEFQLKQRKNALLSQHQGMAKEIQEREKHSDAILSQLLALRRLVDRN